jgi:hypothetical protein
MCGCGYYNPYVANSNSKPITLNRSLWANKTGEVGLENTMYQSLSNWLRKSGLIHLVDKADGADYILTGSIDSIDYPELSYGSNQQANELRANLHVTFSITDKNSAQKVWTISKTFTETLPMSSNPTTLQTNKKEALLNISEDISEMIYLHIINKMMRPADDSASK